MAAVAAIEVYNKPAFAYREEAFALLMTNAWELLLKAKWVMDHSDAEESLYLPEVREGVKHPPSELAWHYGCRRDADAPAPSGRMIDSQHV